MKFSLPALAIFSATLAAAQSISAPLVAVFRDDSQHLQRVVGIAGSLVVPPLDGSQPSAIWNAAFNGKSGMVKTTSQLLILDESGATVNSFDAPSGDALFAFSRAGSPALAFFAGTGDVWRITAGGLQDSMPTAGLFDDVLTVDMANSGVRLVARSGENFFIARMNFDTGEILATDSIPAVTAALPIGRSLLLADASGLLLRQPNGDLARLNTGVDLSPGIRALQLVGDNLVRVALQDASYLLRFTPGGPELTRIPAAGVSQ